MIGRTDPAGPLLAAAPSWLAVVLAFVLAFVLAIAPPAFVADRGAPPLHGQSDAFHTDGVAIAWGVLRGADEARTLVVLRINADSGRYPVVEVAGVDPFTGNEIVRRPPSDAAGPIEIRTPRAQFADYPHTIVRFHGPARDAARRTPALSVLFHGVPDTTPEFVDAARLDAHLAARLAARPAARPAAPSAGTRPP